MGLSVWRETSKKLTVYRVCYTPIETMGLSVWRETSKKLTVYRVCYTPIETLLDGTISGNTIVPNDVQSIEQLGYPVVDSR